MFRAQAGNFSSDSDHKPPAPRPRRRRGGRSRSEKRDRAETERASTDHLSPPEKRRTVTPETTEKEPKEYQPSAPQLSEAEEEDGEWVPIEAAETESPASASCPSESGHVAGVGGGGNLPFQRLSSQRKGGTIQPSLPMQEKRTECPAICAPFSLGHLRQPPLCPSCTKGGNGFQWKCMKGGEAH